LSPKSPAPNEKFKRKKKLKEGIKSLGTYKPKSQSPPQLQSTFEASNGMIWINKNRSNSMYFYHDQYNHQNQLSNNQSPSQNETTQSDQYVENNYNANVINEKKLIMDCHIIRQRALEKARLKSDDELGIRMPQNIKRLIMPLNLGKAETSVGEKNNSENQTIKNEIYNQESFKTTNNMSANLQDQLNYDSRRLTILNTRNSQNSECENKYQSRTESDIESENENQEVKSNEKLERSELNNRENKNSKGKIVYDEGSLLFGTCAPLAPVAPLAQSEAFEYFDDYSPPNRNSKQSPNLTNSNKNENFTLKSEDNKNKEPFKQLNEYRLLTLCPSQPSKPKPKSPPTISINQSASMNSIATINIKNVSPGSGKGGILKNFSTSKPPANLETNIGAKPISKFGKEWNNLTPTLKNERLLKSTISLSASEKSNANASKSSLSNAVNNITNSFNALNVTNSPRLARNSRMAKLNSKRQLNEEKRLDKQRQEKRLRMSQDIQRKLDEIETKLTELNQDGMHLEKIIGQVADNRFETKEKLERELYNIINEKNILTRIENELNIQ
jgi:hypothetical protein